MFWRGIEMSEVAVLQFIQQISVDTAFAVSVLTNAGKDVEKIVKFADEHGYHFTAEEFESIFGSSRRTEQESAAENVAAY
jgi:hypothetical protein